MRTTGGTTATPMEEPADRRPDGTPTDTNPSLTIADFGPAPIGVPNFVIDQFTIPPFLLPIYQACGTQYGIPWQVLASINRIETAFGTNLNVSTAGALGWMQFIPSTWEMYGVDANNDGRKDPYNPVDAICAAARYLKAAGGEDDLRTAIFAYNHADWYVDEVLLYANQYGKLPEPLVSSLTGLTEGARFPVAANARYADDISEREALERSKPGKGARGQRRRRDLRLTHTSRDQHLLPRGRAGGRRQRRRDHRRSASPKKLGRYIILRDAYGNRFTYAQLGEVADVYPVPKPKRLSAEGLQARHPRRRRGPDEPASAGTQVDDESAADGAQGRERRLGRRARRGRRRRSTPRTPASASTPSPSARNNADRADLTGQLDSLLAQKMPGLRDVQGLLLPRPALRPEDDGAWSGSRRARRSPRAPCSAGSRKTDELAPHLHFSIRPAGRGAPKIDPKPILDGWKLLEATAIYRAAGKDPFTGSAHRRPGAADVEAAADPADAHRPVARDLRLRSRATSAPARSTAGCWRCSSTSPPAGTS